MISNIKSCFPHTWKVFILAMRAGTKNEEIVKNVQSTNKHALFGKQTQTQKYKREVVADPCLDFQMTICDTCREKLLKTDDTKTKN